MAFRRMKRPIASLSVQPHLLPSYIYSSSTGHPNSRAWYAFEAHMHVDEMASATGPRWGQTRGPDVANAI